MEDAQTVISSPQFRNARNGNFEVKMALHDNTPTIEIVIAPRRKVS